MVIATPLRSLVAIATLALAAGCSGASLEAPPDRAALPAASLRGAPHRGNIVTVSGVVPMIQRHVKTHFVRGKPITNAVFISDYGNNDVTVFDFPQKSVIGTIGSLSNPQGMWIDGSSNLWIANTGASDILEYAKPWNGAPIGTLPDANQYPADVTLDASGNVYASSVISASGGGNVVMYPHGSGSGNQLDMKNACFNCYFLAVDRAGNVWVDGFDSAFAPIVGYWGPGGKGSFTKVGITFNFPGGIEFDRRGDLLLVDQQGNLQANSSTVSVYPPGSTQPSKVCGFSGNNNDVVTIALGTVQKRLFTADAGLAAPGSPILTWPQCEIPAMLSEPNASSPIGVAANPASS